MWLEISYETARTRYPNEVAEVLAKFKKSKSKHKATPPEFMAWGFDWCVRIDGGSNIMDIISGKQPSQPKVMTEDEDAADYAGRCYVHLSAKIGKAGWSSETQLAQPKEIDDNYRAYLKQTKAEQAWFAALTPEQQNEELNKTLEKLGRSPGFMRLDL